MKKAKKKRAKKKVKNKVKKKKVKKRAKKMTTTTMINYLKRNMENPMLRLV